MRAKCTKVGFKDDMLVLSVSCYFEEGEEGYKKYLLPSVRKTARGIPITCLRPNRPVVKAKLLARPNLTTYQLGELMKAHLEKLKESIPKSVSNKKVMVGVEVTY